MRAAISWTFQHERYAEAIQLIEGVRYYYNVRGLWDDRLAINQRRAEAARHLGDYGNQALALAHHVEIRSKQGNLAEARECLAQLECRCAAVVRRDCRARAGHPGRGRLRQRDNASAHRRLGARQRRAGHGRSAAGDGGCLGRCGRDRQLVACGAAMMRSASRAQPLPHLLGRQVATT
jgi:hypothetical protein